MENLPPNTETVPVIGLLSSFFFIPIKKLIIVFNLTLTKGIFYLGSMMIISLAVMSTVLTLNVYKRGENGEPVPRWLRVIFFNLLARILFVRVKINQDVSLSVKEAFEMNHTYVAYVKKLKKASSRRSRSSNSNNPNSRHSRPQSRSTFRELKSFIAAIGYSGKMSTTG